MGRISDFLEIYSSISTKKAYQSGILKFLEFIYNRKRKNKCVTDEEMEQFEELAEEYLNSQRDFERDLLNFTSFLSKKGTPPKTANLYIVAVKEWFIWNGIEISQKVLKEIKHKKPKGGAITEEDIITKETLRKILTNCDIKGKALFIFLATTGLRLNEALSIEIDDLKMENDPPEVLIRASYTKTQEKRVVFLTTEAKEYLLQWLEVRDKFLKESYDRTKNFRKVNKTPIDLNSKKVFPFCKKTVYEMWYEALKKSNLLKTDKYTNRLTLRVHGLRKFFRTQLVKARIPQEVINALMGHGRSSLEQVYTKFPKEEIIEMWKSQAELELTIYGSPDVERLREELKRKEEALKRKEVELEEKMRQLQREVDLKIEKEVSVFKGTVEALVKDKIELEYRLKNLERENELLRKKICDLEQSIVSILTSIRPQIKIDGKTDADLFEFVKKSNPDFVLE